MKELLGLDLGYLDCTFFFFLKHLLLFGRALFRDKGILTFLWAFFSLYIPISFISSLLLIVNSILMAMLFLCCLSLYVVYRA